MNTLYTHSTPILNTLKIYHHFNSFIILINTFSSRKMSSIIPPNREKSRNHFAQRFNIIFMQTPSTPIYSSCMFLVVISIFQFTQFWNACFVILSHELETRIRRLDWLLIGLLPYSRKNNTAAVFISLTFTLSDQYFASSNRYRNRLIMFMAF